MTRATLFTPLRLGTSSSQPHRDRADVPVLGRGRVHDRLARHPPRPPRALRRGAADHRGDRRAARGTDHLRATSASGRTRPRRRMARMLDSVRRWSDMPIAIQLAHAGRKASTECRGKAAGRSRRRAGRLADGRALGRSRSRTANTRRWRSIEPGCGRPRRLRGRGAARGAARPRRGADPRRARLPAAPVPLAARRTAATDAYGGSLENRMRFPLEVFDAVRGPRSRRTGP